MEILFTSIIVLFAGYIIFKSLSKSSKGECNCTSCDKHCPSKKNNL